MMWKCFECGRMFRKTSDSVACVQKPTCASTISVPAESEIACRITAKNDPAGDGQNE